MEIRIKQLKKIIKDDTIIAKATDIDTQGVEGSIKGNKILEGGEVGIFESQVSESLDAKTYQEIFGFEKTNKAPSSSMDMSVTKGNGNTVISEKPAEIKTNVQFNSDGSIKGSMKIATGTITLTDENGNQINIPLEMDIRYLQGSNKKEAYETIIKDLQKAIAQLPPNLRSDLVNEVNKFKIGTENVQVDVGDGKGAHFFLPLGSFSPDNGVLTLNRSDDGHRLKNGVTMNILAHELGHAKDELGSEYQSEGAFANSFNQLVKALPKSSVTAYSSHKDDLEQGYWLKNHKEAVAELTGYFADIEQMKKKGEIPHFDYQSRYYLLNKVMTSDDPKIKPIAQEMLKHYKAIMDNTTSQTPQDRKSNNSIEAAKKRIEILNFKFSPADKELYKNYTSLIYEDEFYDYFNDGKSSRDIVLQYWQYLHKDGTSEKDKAIYGSLDDETKKVFTKLDEKANQNPPLQSWINVRAAMDQVLSRINLKQ